MFAGSESVGPVVSRTVTLKDLWVKLLCASIALQRTDVVPIANVLLAGGVQTTGTLPSTASVAVGLGQETGAPWALVASAVMSAGTLLITGPVVSRTVTLKLPVATLRAVSVAEHCTAVVPSGKTVPDAGV